MALAVHHTPLNAYTGSQLKLQCVLCFYCNASTTTQQSTLVTDTNHVPKDIINVDRKERYHTRRSGDGGASGAAIHTASGARLGSKDLIASHSCTYHLHKEIRAATKVIVRFHNKD